MYVPTYTSTKRGFFCNIESSHCYEFCFQFIDVKMEKKKYIY